MSQKTSSTLFAFLALASLLVFTASSNTSAQAQSIQTSGSEAKCMSCHEDLYFLHDTGKWFCLRESPMSCAECHGGNPKAVTQELAHLRRAAHPILNGDTSKCQECHPAERDERVAKFDQVAGISSVLVAIPYQRISVVNSEQSQQAQPGEPDEYPGWILVMEIMTTILISGLVLVLYLIHRRHDNQKQQP